MKHKLPLVLALVGFLSPPVSGQQVLTGDTRLACEAILCLSSGLRPGECTPSLQRYFGISLKKLSDTLRARANFLRLCPVSDQTPQMTSLVNAIANGSGRCDAEALNAALRSWNGDTVFISNQVPDYCPALLNHAYTSPGDLAPKYVGTPERGGYWVEAKDYERAFGDYKARIAAEDAQRLSNLGQ